MFAKLKKNPGKRRKDVCFKIPAFAVPRVKKLLNDYQAYPTESNRYLLWMAVVDAVQQLAAYEHEHRQMKFVTKDGGLYVVLIQK